jgi:hypothetical protein
MDCSTEEIGFGGILEKTEKKRTWLPEMTGKGKVSRVSMRNLVS